MINRFSEAQTEIDGLFSGVMQTLKTIIRLKGFIIQLISPDERFRRGQGLLVNGL
jgi:hypothetical protein